MESCFRITEADLSFQEAIVYEKLAHDFGTFDRPSNLFELFKSKALSGSADFKLAFDISKPKWLGKVDGMISSTDDYTGYDEYSQKVKKMHTRWYLAAADADADAGSRYAQMLSLIHI